MATNFKVSGSNFEDTFLRRDLFTEGGLWGWGFGDVYRLGNGSITNRANPTQVGSLGANWKAPATGGGATNAAIKTDGTLWLWGWNIYGQLGTGNNSNQQGAASTPVQTISAGTNWKSVHVGNGYSVRAIKADGTLWTWGRNGNFELGDNTQLPKSSPIQTVAGGTTWKFVGGGFYHAAGIKTDGTLWMWGRNTNGSLGNGTTSQNGSPVQTVAGGNNWKLAYGGVYHTAAIKTDGTLWTWGENTNGELGDNTVVHKSSPVQTVAGGTNWKVVACGRRHNVAIKNDGTLWTWGANGNGQLGDDTRVKKSSPVQTVAGGTNWKLVAAGGYVTAAIKTDGTLWTWGYGYYGGLGNGDTTGTASRSSPIQTSAGGTNWKLVGCGGYTSFAIRSDV